MPKTPPKLRISNFKPDTRSRTKTLPKLRISNFKPDTQIPGHTDRASIPSEKANRDAEVSAARFGALHPVAILRLRAARATTAEFSSLCVKDRGPQLLFSGVRPLRRQKMGSMQEAPGSSILERAIETQLLALRSGFPIAKTQ